jgi:SAM-dependent methyltransferase
MQKGSRKSAHTTVLSLEFRKLIKQLMRKIVDLRKFEREGKLFKTLNGMGHSIAKLTDYSEEFVTFAPLAPGPVLDIGAAFGVASLPALELGAEVIINDMAQEHLDQIAAKMPEVFKERVHYHQGRAPDELSFADESLGAIHASQVFHFLKGAEIEKLFELMFRWLKPNGKIFIIISSPYINILKNFLPLYEQRKREGVRWPGEVENLKEFTTHPVADDNPPFFNFIDDSVLRQTALDVGFVIEKLTLFDRDDLPDHIKYDGRENVGLIARKPALKDQLT